MTATLTMGMWPVTYLLQQCICLSYGVYKNSVEVLHYGKLNAIALKYKNEFVKILLYYAEVVQLLALFSDTSTF
jgi:hypothetical protein